MLGFLYHHQCCDWNYLLPPTRWWIIHVNSCSGCSSLCMHAGEKTWRWGWVIKCSKRRKFESLLNYTNCVTRRDELQIDSDRRRLFRLPISGTNWVIPIDWKPVRRFGAVFLKGKGLSISQKAEACKMLGFLYHHQCCDWNYLLPPPLWWIIHGKSCSGCSSLCMHACENTIGLWHRNWIMAWIMSTTLLQQVVVWRIDNVKPNQPSGVP